MKIFVSWSGELSKKVAEKLKKWLPCILQSVEVFYSPEDIEKGENWDAKIAKELSDCHYGIICLSSENTSAPWINFEAGAIAKTLDSRVAALMINIKPSDIQGPLKRYQATKLDQNDMHHLLSDINNSTDNPLSVEVFDTMFNAVWGNMYNEIKESIEEYIPENRGEKKDLKSESGDAIEEILQLVRKQNNILNSPEVLLPPSYFEFICANVGFGRDKHEYQQCMNFLADRVEKTLNRVHEIKSSNESDTYRLMLIESGLFELLDSLIDVFGDTQSGIPHRRVVNLRRKYVDCM